jgi:integrase
MTRHQNPALEKRIDVPEPFWYIRVYVPVITEQGQIRQQKRIQLGRCAEMTRRQAMIAREEFLATVNAGKTVAAAQLPFNTVIDRYIAYVLPNRASTTAAKVRGYLEGRVRPALGALPTYKVDALAIQELVNSSKLGWWAKQDLRNAVKAVFTYAKKIGVWKEDNPASGVEMGKQKKWLREKRIPDAEGLSRFLSMLPTTQFCSAEEARRIALTAIVSGFRVSEVLGLQVRDLDYNAQTVTIARRWHRGDLDDPKTDSSRRCRVVGPLIFELQRQAEGRQPDGFLFTNALDGQPHDDRQLQRLVWKPAAEHAGIYHLGFGMHSFRRLNITWRQQAGATSIEAMQHAGHSSVNMTFLYSITDQQREREQVERMWLRLLPEPPKE